jgi:hypothetical protein
MKFRPWVVLTGAVTALAATPLLVARPAPFMDWPNHLARVEILTRLVQGDSFWRQYYQINHLLLPNAAMDIGVTALRLAGFPAWLSGQLFLLLIFFGFVGGGMALARALTTADPVKPVLLAMLFYNGALIDGFANYMAGLGAAFWVLALWARASPAARYPIALAGCVAVFFAHLLAALVLLAAIGLLELELVSRPGGFRVANLARHASGITAAVAVCVLFLLSPTGGGILSADTAHHFGYAGAPFVPGIIAGKLKLLGHAVLDGAGGRGAAIMTSGVLACAGVAIFAARLRLNRPSIFLAVGLNALWLVLPDHIGDEYFLDYHLVAAPLAIMVAAVEIDSRSAAARRWGVTILLLVSLCRTVSFIDDYRRDAATYQAFRQAAGAIASDSVLLTAIGTRRERVAWTEVWSPPTDHLATLVVANDVFVPSTFAFRSLQPIVLKPGYDGWGSRHFLADDASAPGTLSLFGQVCARWRADGHGGGVYLVIVYPSDFSDGYLRQFPMIATDAKFRLYRLCGI